MFFEQRDKLTSSFLIKEIKKLAKQKELIKIMHVCGTHEMTIARWKIRDVLPKNIKIICGPGCPVCVTSAKEIDLAIKLALKKEIILTTFGDVLRVPGSTSMSPLKSSRSLSEAKSENADVRIVYGIDEAIEIAKKNLNRQVVHLAIGFETTAPTTAIEILENQDFKNFSIICSHRLIPPAMKALLESGESKIDGFICPGHVSTIIGSLPYKPLAKKFKKPFVVAGFEPNDVLLSILIILKQLNKTNCDVCLSDLVQNEYVRLVKPEGNKLALKKMQEVFEVCDKSWRGIGIIPKSGLKLRKKFIQFDAEQKFKLFINYPAMRDFDNHRSKLSNYDVMPGCKCGEIMKGLAEPKDCQYFKKQCTPSSPIGACIVSIEGPCNVAFKN
ncbi:MAG: hydrogenase formation protein HypD [Candidatus Kuenenbacteria bacterium]